MYLSACKSYVGLTFGYMGVHHPVPNSPPMAHLESKGFTSDSASYEPWVKCVN